MTSITTVIQPTEPINTALTPPSAVVTVVAPPSPINVTLAIGQGPAGPPGAASEGLPGQPGVGYVIYMAAGPVGGHRVMRAAFSSFVRYASCDVPNDASAVIGISLNAAADGDPVNVATSGEVVEPSWSWVEDLPIFVGLDGALTQIPPETGFQLVIAVATSPTSAIVSVKQPVILL